MKKLSIKFLAMSALLMIFSACGDLDVGKGKEPDADATIPSFGADMSVLWAINTKTSMETGLGNLGIGDIEVDFGTAVAFFVNGGKNVSVGEVSVNETALKSQSNNVYTFIPSLVDALGIDLGDRVTWQIEGGNGFNAAEYRSRKWMPNVGGLNADETVDKSSSYTVTVSTVSNADSIYYGISDVHKIVEASVKSVTFTAAELSKLKKGDAFVQVAPYNYYMETNNGKDLVIGNQAVISKLVKVK